MLPVWHLILPFSVVLGVRQTQHVYLELNQKDSKKMGVKTSHVFRIENP